MGNDVLGEHLGYISDPVRLDAYQAAIRRIVRAGFHVADLGCGTGVLGLMCLQSGAARVYAIDSTEMIEVAGESFSRSGLGDKAVFTHDRSACAELPERVDLVICDQVGYFGFDAGIVQYYEDAKRRFLKPGGALVPARIRMQVAAVESASCYRQVQGWESETVPSEFRWVRERAVNSKYPVQLRREELLTPPAALGCIDFYDDNPGFFSWTAELQTERDGTLHGLAGWFECELAEGVWMTNSPLAEKPIQRPQAFLPIREAVQVKAGERVKLTVMTRPRDNLIAWVVELPSGQRFSQSTWQGMLFTREDLARTNSTHMPQPSREGRARLTVLGYCDGGRTAREIEEAILRDHPDLFPSPGEISRFVAHVLGRDTE